MSAPRAAQSLPFVPRKRGPSADVPNGRKSYNIHPEQDALAVSKPTTLRIGIASRDQMKARTLAVARGEHKRRRRRAEGVAHVLQVAYRVPDERTCAPDGADKPVKPAMKAFEFSVIASGSDPAQDDVLDRFYEAAGMTRRSASRMAVSSSPFRAGQFEDALAGAMADVTTAGAKVPSVEPSI